MFVKIAECSSNRTILELKYGGTLSTVKTAVTSNRTILELKLRELIYPNP